MDLDHDPDGGSSPSRYLVKRPKALQWFYNGQLQKESDEERQAGRFELFLDLLYVAIVANFSEHLAEHPDGEHLVQYLLTFWPAWHIWSDLREIMNSFYTDDIVQRCAILWVMAMLVLYANNANEIAEINALRTTAGAYMVARFTVAMALLISSFASYQHRVQSRIAATFILIGLFLVIPLFFEDISIRGKIAVVAVIIAYQEVAWLIAFGPWIKKALNLTYSTAVDISHEIDRLAAFFIIILGEFLYGIVVGSPAGIGISAGYGRAVCTLVIAFSLNWLYTSGDGSLESTHPIRRSVWTAFAFFTIHLPLSASFLIGGHICAVSVGESELEEGQTRLMGGGLGVGMFCLWIFAQLHRSDDHGELVLFKQSRVSMRLVVAIILIAISQPVIDISTTSLLVIEMAVIVWVVLWETIGGMSKRFKVFESWEGRNAPERDQSVQTGNEEKA
ncbi:hypothetical protein PRZ48_008330 [Zasmidium cellare]|uniref:Low temperature requirement A n=1 Tax=Zasmidium cellare TaxID=395010 RepID=A0ABR0EFI9_ZASCE|nr:hypothetical protein PRZ48_008330 [Zasmidium cellare]